MKRLLLTILAATGCLFSFAQLLSWTPPFPVDNDPSQTLVITVDATKGNQGLLNYTPTSDVYVHIGVITNKSANPGDWQHAPFAWGKTNQPAAKANYLASNKWQYN